MRPIEAEKINVESGTTPTKLFNAGSGQQTGLMSVDYLR